MKRLCRMLIAFVLALALLPVASVVQAQTAEVPENALEQAIIASCTYNRKIDISQFDITPEELTELFAKMIDRGDLPWYTIRDYFCAYDEDSEKALTFEPRLYPDYKYNRAFYQQRLEEILQECVLEGMSDWQIALSIHDYLVIHGYYDESLNERTGYDLLKNGRTVCTGYTEVYRELLNMAGIPCVNVVSEAMRHTWNLIQIGGNWYHVDVTWDDPVPDCYGRVGHQYFLLTDAEISSGDDPHHSWETDIQCVDTTYSNAFWRDIDSPILFTDSDTCYLIRDQKFSNTIYKRTLSSSKETAIYKEKGEYINIGEGSYRYQHYGLSIWNKRLWVGTMTKVLSMDLNGKDVRTEFTYAAEKNKRYIAGFYVHKDYIRYLAREHSGYETSYIETLESTGYHIHKYTQTVIKPTCGVDGYTISECCCGIRCQSSFTYQLEHEFAKMEGIAPSVWKEGMAVEQCIHCGEKHTKVLPRVSLANSLMENGAFVGTVVGGIVGVIAVMILSAAKKKKKLAPKPAAQTEVGNADHQIL